jgi:hypothetical protein
LDLNNDGKADEEDAKIFIDKVYIYIFLIIN